MPNFLFRRERGREGRERRNKHTNKHTVAAILVARRVVPFCPRLCVERGDTKAGRVRRFLTKRLPPPAPLRRPLPRLRVFSCATHLFLVPFPFFFLELFFFFFAILCRFVFHPSLSLSLSPHTLENTHKNVLVCTRYLPRGDGDGGGATPRRATPITRLAQGYETSAFKG